MLTVRLRMLLLSMLALLVAPSLRAENAADVPAQPHAAAKTTRGLFWEVHGKKGTAYLLGSVHMANKSIYPLPAEIENAFASADALAVEVDITKNVADMQQKLMQAGTYKDGGSLKANVAPETYEKVQHAIKTSGMSLANFDQFKPWMVAMLLEAVAAQKAGLDPSQGIDLHFLNEAKEKGKSVREIEGFDLQLNLFAGFSAPEQEAMLFSTAVELPKFKSSIKKMMDAWTKGDAEGMNKLIHEDDDAYPKLKPFVKALLDDRNNEMAKKVAEYLDAGGTTFVVVGAAHLVGPTGVAAQLKAKGYTVTQK